MSKEKKIIIGLICALLVAVGVIVGLLVSGVFSDDSKTPSRDSDVEVDSEIDPSWTEVEVLSSSMSAENALPEHRKDAIESGDTVYLDDTPAEEIQIGDVIGFYESDIIVVHKVYDIIEANESASGQREFVTFGINNFGVKTDDNGNTVMTQMYDAEPALAENVIGKVVHRVPSLRNAFSD